jgi:hypothetical protein
VFLVQYKIVIESQSLYVTIYQKLMRSMSLWILIMSQSPFSISHLIRFIHNRNYTLLMALFGKMPMERVHLHSLSSSTEMLSMEFGSRGTTLIWFFLAPISPSPTLHLIRSCGRLGPRVIQKLSKIKEDLFFVSGLNIALYSLYPTTLLLFSLIDPCLAWDPWPRCKS